MRYKSSPLSVRHVGTPPSPPVRPPGKPHPAAAWIATFLMIALLPAIIVPTLVVRGAQPTITVPRQSVPGATITVAGADFRPGLRGVVTLSDLSLSFTVGADGRFGGSLPISAQTPPGRYRVVAREVDNSGRASRELARTTIAIEPAGLSRRPASSSAALPTAELISPPMREVDTATPAPTAEPALTESATTAPPPPSPPAATPVPATPVPAPPAPPAAPTGKGTGRVFVMAPNGSDAGAGTAAAPWLTYGHASSFLKPGDTLYARGGQYVGQGGYSWNPGASGAPGAPIWFAAYPGETPVFDGGNAQEQFLIFHDQVHHIVVDGLRIQNYHPVQNGILLMINGAHDIVLQNLVMAGNHGTSATPIEHLIYPGASPYNITIRTSVLDAAGMSGGAIHMYHDPGPRNVLIEGNVIRNGHWGVIVASSANGVTIRNNAFSGNRRANIEVWSAAVNVIVTGNSPNNNILD